jgi:hypothetical protein
MLPVLNAEARGYPLRVGVAYNHSPHVPRLVPFQAKVPLSRLWIASRMEETIRIGPDLVRVQIMPLGALPPASASERGQVGRSASYRMRDKMVIV